MLYNRIAPKYRKLIYKLLAVAVPVVSVLAGAEAAGIVVSIAGSLGFVLAHGNVSDY